jgi:hypothetical protein
LLDNIRKLIVGGGQEISTEPTLKLGSKVRDTVTGFKGTAIGYVVHLYGCTRICIEPGLDKDGKLQETSWFDTERVELLEDKIAVKEPTSVAVSGGPQNDPAYRRSL